MKFATIDNNGDLCIIKDDKIIYLGVNDSDKLLYSFYSNECTLIVTVNTFYKFVNGMMTAIFLNISDVKYYKSGKISFVSSGHTSTYDTKTGQLYNNIINDAVFDGSYEYRILSTSPSVVIDDHSGIIYLVAHPYHIPQRTIYDKVLIKHGISIKSARYKKHEFG